MEESESHCEEGASEAIVRHMEANVMEQKL